MVPARGAFFDRLLGAFGGEKFLCDLKKSAKLDVGRGWLTKSTALEYVRQGLRVNAVCPGVTRTPMLEGFMGGDSATESRVKEGNPSGRIGTPEETAEAVLWLCSSAASFVNGACLSVDGGAVAK